MLNVKDFGAIGDNTHDDTTAIQSAIDAVIAAGGGTVLFPAGEYKITTALTLATGASDLSVILDGVGPQATKLSQATSTENVITVGVNSSYYVTDSAIRNMTLSGGKHALSLNNVIHSVFDGLMLQGSEVGLYGMGQIERNWFMNLSIDSCTLHGAWFGNSNGVTVSTGVGDFPEAQKNLFDHIKFGGISGGTAFLITAGVFDGVQQSSGFNLLRQIRFEGCDRTCLELHFCGITYLEDMDNEGSISADDTYYVIDIEDSSYLIAKQLYIGAAYSPHNYKHYVHLGSGRLDVDSSILCVGAAAATADVYIADAFKAQNVIVTNEAAVVWANSLVKRRAFLLDVLDSVNVPIQWSDPTIAAVNHNFSNTNSRGGLDIPSHLKLGQGQIMVSTDTGLVVLQNPESNDFGRLSFGLNDATHPCLQSNAGTNPFLGVVQGGLGAYADIKAGKFIINSPQTYTVTHPTTNRSLDVTGTTANALQVLGTLIADLQAAGLIS